MKQENKQEITSKQYSEKILEVAYHNFPLVYPKETVLKCVNALIEEYGFRLIKKEGIDKTESFKVEGDLKLIHRYGQPEYIRDARGVLVSFPKVTKYQGQEERYIEEINESFSLANIIINAIKQQNKANNDFYCHDELVRNAAECFESPKCTKQCDKCKFEFIK